MRAPFVDSERECSTAHLATQLRKQGYIAQLRNAKPKECGKARGRTCLEKLQHTYILVTGSLDSAVTVSLHQHLQNSCLKQSLCQRGLICVTQVGICSEPPRLPMIRPQPRHQLCRFVGHIARVHSPGSSLRKAQWWPHLPDHLAFCHAF